MNTNIATLIRSFAPQKAAFPYYIINDKKYICQESVDIIFIHIHNMITMIDNQIEEVPYVNFVKLLKSVKMIVEDDRDYLDFDNSDQHIIDINLKYKKVYLYDTLEDYFENYYNIVLTERLANYENNVEEFIKQAANKNHIDLGRKFTTELKNAAKLFRLRYKSNQYYKNLK
jgi:hypothetical protein